ncbi:MAG TPA: EAL domain-containing protein [Candidatus Elarobacter sp.]|jgi:PAS domain S-box-containing protein|nr:EAL domain-containing protein [Candidatus Elarobacter sp.]
MTEQARGAWTARAADRVSEGHRGRLDAFSVLFDSNPVPMAIFDGGSMVFRAVNDAMLAAYRYRREDFLYLTMLTVRPADERARFLAWQTGSADSRGTHRPTGIWHHLAGDGVLIEAEFERSPRFIYHGREVYLATFFDVTDRNHARDLWHARTVALETAERVAGVTTFSLDLRTGEHDGSNSAPLMERPASEAYDQSEDTPKSIADNLPFETEYQHSVDERTRWTHSGTQLVYGDDGAVTHIVGVNADVTERRTLADRFLELAYHDAETGLLNREAMLNDGTTLSDATTGVVLLHADMVAGSSDRDRSLKRRVAQDAARVIVAVVGAGATVVRYSDEVFAVVIGRPGGARSIVSIAKRLLACFEHPLRVGEDECVIVPAIGVGVARGRKRDPFILCREAECALDAARHAGSRFAVYDDVLGATADRRVLIERNLRRAIAQRGLRAVYQPIVSLGTGRIVGAEALMRWNCPGIGDVPPSEFIPIAEQNGAIHKLGDWILRKACAQARNWNAAGYPLRVAVNVSAQQLNERDFVKTVDAACESTALDPAALELEVTEGIMLGYDGMALRNLQALRRRGARVSIDDFGTGYSSLSHLKSLPLDTLKIDRSFVASSLTDAFQAEVTRSVIALAHRRGLYVVAEGIETAEQFELLRAMGCDEAQGYFMSRPVDEAAFLECLGHPARSGWANEPLGAAATYLGT